MINKREHQFDDILSATCDCCGADIKVQFGRIMEDHMTIGGYRHPNNLEAIVCIKCMDDKFKFVNIKQTRNTIGEC